MFGKEWLPFGRKERENDVIETVVELVGIEFEQLQVESGKMSVDAVADKVIDILKQLDVFDAEQTEPQLRRLREEICAWAESAGIGEALIASNNAAADRHMNATPDGHVQNPIDTYLEEISSSN